MTPYELYYDALKLSYPDNPVAHAVAREVRGLVTEEWESAVEKNLELDRENARLRKTLADAPHDKHCSATRLVTVAGNSYIRDPPQAELCDCWKAALARSPLNSDAAQEIPK